jgi:hypothetical protein
MEQICWQHPRRLTPSHALKRNDFFPAAGWLRMAITLLGGTLATFAQVAKPVSPGNTVLPTMAAGSADGFVDFIGIDVHFNYYGSIYTQNTPLMLERMNQLGVRHLRDAMCWQGPQTWNTFYALHRQLGGLGYKTDYVMGPSQPVAQASAYPGMVLDMEAVEAPNEWDDTGDANWARDITAVQAQLFSAMRQAAGGRNVKVLAPSLAYPQDAPALGNVSAISDAGNLHGYFGGYNPGSSVVNAGYYLSVVSQNTPKQPIWVTETGYFGQPGPIIGQYGVPQTIQATYTPRALLEYWRAGAARTYLYELADDLEPGESPAQFQWGLLDSAGGAKPAFTILANLIGLLEDPGPAFTPAPLPLSIQSSSPSVHYALFGKRDGTYYLALWNEVQSYDFMLERPIRNNGQQVTLTVGRPVAYNGTQQFTNEGQYTTQAFAPSQTLKLPVTDNLQIVTWVFAR